MGEMSGSGSNTYQGPDTEEDYARWLRLEYGEVASHFPPVSVVCLAGDEVHEWAVVGYLKVDGKPTVCLLDLAEMKHTAYEDYSEKTRVLCPEHELPQLKYLYNQNGAAFAAKFRQAG